MDTNKRLVLGLAALCHDMGKPLVTDPATFCANGHDQAGVAPAAAFLASIGAPKDIVDQVLPLVANHMVRGHDADTLSDRSVRRLANRLAPATINDLAAIIQADQCGRGAASHVRRDKFADALIEKAADLRVADAAPKPLVQGRHLIAIGVKPGPAMGQMLRDLFQKQMDGVFNTVEDGVAVARTMVKGD